MIHLDMSQQQVKRPSVNELNGKIASAISIVAAGSKFVFANDSASMSEIRAEGHDIDHLEEDILACLKELTCKDYAGSRPPQKSYEDKIDGNELFAFAWESAHMGERMYLKFVIKNGIFYYVSFHRDRKE